MESANNQDRLQLLSALVTSLPPAHLALIPEILSEAVLGTKEVNEKARDAGFDLLVVMGNKMVEGGSVTRTIAVEGEEEDGVGQEGMLYPSFLIDFSFFLPITELLESLVLATHFVRVS
jgi:hypothetical protein